MVYKVQVSPTNITFSGPNSEATNRILRRFPNHSDYFVRVQFADEDGLDLRFNSRENFDLIYERYTGVFTNGIPIAGRRYQFLGFSHSSLRGHSAWFMAPFYANGFQTHFSVIEDLGDFSEFNSPARCAARIGQAFSETPFAISLQEYGIRHETIRDVKNGERIFTDGVGTISPEVVRIIQSVLPSRKGKPTCFQIRFAGAKGMLALDSRLKGRVMRLRPSMVKFNASDEDSLEICDAANKPIPLFLNRQVRLLLPNTLHC